MSPKEEVARTAISMIKDNSVIGLGAGSNIAQLVTMLLPQIASGLTVRLTTASTSTHRLLIQQGLTVFPISQFEKIAIHFDGCDQLDKDLNALKSGGGIHTMEKLLASMADQFVILGDDSKLVDHFDERFPIVMEVLPQAAGYVTGFIQLHFPLAKTAFRTSEKKDGYVITENGNYLLDFWIMEWPELAALNNMLKQVTGVVETSLFYRLADKAIIATTDGVRILER